MSMHLSGRGELGQDVARGGWPKGLSSPSLPLLPLKMEVGWIRLEGHTERTTTDPTAPGQRRRQNQPNDKKTKGSGVGQKQTEMLEINAMKEVLEIN